MTTILHALLCSLVATCWHSVLTTPGHVLGWFPRWAKRLEGCSLTSIRARVVIFLTWGLIECSWCMAGQVALIHYLTTTPWGHDLATWTTYAWDLAFQVCASIMFAVAITTAHDRHAGEDL